MEITEEYLRLVDRAAPGLVDGLYLLGSIALDDYRPGPSDVDFLAVTARRPEPADVAALARVHSELNRSHPRPYFDGLYLTWEDLARPPAGVVSTVHEHRFGTSDFAVDPVTWHTLADAGVAVRGPDRSALTVWTDRAALKAWNAANVEHYWAGWRRRYGRRPYLTRWATAWGVLGMARICHTVRTGRLVSKSAAGELALETFPEQWHPILHEALRLRRGERTAVVANPFARRAQTLGFLDAAIERVRSEAPHR